MLQKGYFCCDETHTLCYKKRDNFRLRQALNQCLEAQQEKFNAALDELASQQQIRDNSGYQKLILIQLIGELFGQHTLTGLLASVGIKSNQANKQWQKLSYKTLFSWFISNCKDAFLEDYQVLLQQSNSTWSRQNLTLIGDESVFRQWLEQATQSQDEHYYKSYSGQFCRTVWGYKCSMWGIMMNDRFYPLVIKFVKKGEKCTDIAGHCVKEMADFINKHTIGHTKPTLHVSLDSGFNKADLVSKIQGEGFRMIGVPQANHVVTYDEKKVNIKQLKQVFVEKETIHKAEEPTSVAFVWRVKVFYQLHQQAMVLLFFRFQGSQKLSVVFSTDCQASAKTIRRHWFARTSIEQFFRLLKTTLRIQESKSVDYAGFIKKFSLTCLKACFVLSLRNRVRKKVRGWRRSTWADIRRFLAIELGLSWLKSTLQGEPFASDIRLNKLFYRDLNA